MFFSSPESGDAVLISNHLLSLPMLLLTHIAPNLRNHHERPLQKILATGVKLFPASADLPIAVDSGPRLVLRFQAQCDFCVSHFYLCYIRTRAEASY